MREIKERKGKKRKEKDIWTITAPAVPKRIPDTTRLAIYVTKTIKFIHFPIFHNHKSMFYLEDVDYN